MDVAEIRAELEQAIDAALDIADELADYAERPPSSPLRRDAVGEYRETRAKIRRLRRLQREEVSGYGD